MSTPDVTDLTAANHDLVTDIADDLAALVRLLPGQSPVQPPVQLPAPAQSPVQPPVQLPAQSSAPPPAESPSQPLAAAPSMLPPPVSAPAPDPPFALPPALPVPAASSVPGLPTLPTPPPRVVAVPPPGSESAPSLAIVRTVPRPAAPMPPVASKRRKPRGRSVARGVVVHLVISSVLGLAFQFSPARKLFFSDDGKEAAAPKEWDARVTDVVTFVENTRGLTFKHPVPVDFLAEADFLQLFDAPAAEPDGADDESAAKYSALYDAAALAVDYDATAGDTAVHQVTTLGFYSPGDDRIFVRGATLTPAVRTVLAHELTHALQGQYFDLSITPETDLELRSVVEADAMRVEDAYTATLPQSDQTSADADNAIDTTEATGLDGVPWAVIVQGYAPYDLGPRLVRQVFAARGNTGVDELIRNPPSEKELLNPWLYGTIAPDVRVPMTLPAGAVELEASRAMSLLDMVVMFDAWLPWTQTRAAVDGWAGGGYISYERSAGGPVCFASTIAFDSDPAQFVTALQAWAAASASTATPQVDGMRVSFEACDRGSTAPVPPQPLLDPLAELGIEADIVESIGAAPPAEKLTAATCYARRLIDDPAVEPLLHAGDLTAEEQQVLDYLQRTNAEICVFGSNG